MTGVCVGAGGDSLVLINWRTKTVSEVSADTGALLSAFSHEGMREPTDVAVDAEERVAVADNGRGAILVGGTGLDSTVYCCTFPSSPFIYRHANYPKRKFEG